MEDTGYIDFTDQGKKRTGDSKTIYLPNRSPHNNPTVAWSRRTVFLICLAVGLVCTGVGTLIGFFCKHQGDYEKWESLTREADPGIADRIGQEINPESIRHFHSKFSSIPHLAGTEADHQTARQVAGIWKEQGLDSVQISPYNVLLSYPNPQKPNKVEIKSVDGDVVYRSALNEEELTADYNHKDIVPPYNAYSPAGVVEGDLVYVNHASAQDFKQLNLLGIDVRGKIVIARHGAGFRGDKVKNAERAGATGMILFTDIGRNTKVGDVYPNSWWLPGSGIERGSINTLQGDPQTHGFPANEYSYKDSNSTIKRFLPKIPCQPIGYNDAKELLRYLDGPEVPKYWQGGLDIGTYRIGPGYRASSRYGKVRLEVNNYLENRTILNVIGHLRGQLEPDRYILVSNHRDAWVYGAADPISGTAAMMEISRIYGKLARNGFRPRRSVLFCSWSAEEFGLIGSTEYVEHYEKLLMERAVAVLNVDIAVKGNRTLSVRATPAMWDLIYSAAKTVKAPFSNEKSLYDVWDTEMPFKRDTPVVFLPESSTDYAPFLQRTGIEVSDLSFMGSMNSYISNPLYHTRYETVHLINFIDPDFKCHKSIAHVWAEMTRILADSLIIPFNITRLANELHREAREGLKHQESSVHEETFLHHGISFKGIYSAVENFTSAARTFHEGLDIMGRKDPLDMRMVNDKLMQVTRSFVQHGGLPDRPLVRNMVFAPSASNMYLGTIFPGMYDVMHKIQDAANENDKLQHLTTLRRHMSILTHVIQSAAHVLSQN